MKWALVLGALIAAAFGLPAAAQAPTAEAEFVEADVSTRSVAVTSSFTGTEIIVFGTVHNSRQSAEAPSLYDLVVILEGAGFPLVVRRKSRIAGIWANTQSMRVERLPSYYAIASTRPVAEIADQEMLERMQIGFQAVGVKPRAPDGRFSAQDISDYRQAIIRLKQQDNLYVREDYGVRFIGRSLFRTTITLPANIPVGTLRARVILFKNGAVLSQYSAHVKLELEGVERVLHSFAFEHPIFYGVFTVCLAAAAGLAASILWRRRP